jgi:hypothetical protein
MLNLYPFILLYGKEKRTLFLSSALFRSYIFTPLHQMKVSFSIASVDQLMDIEFFMVLTSLICHAS